MAPALSELIERLRHFGTEASAHVEMSYEQGRAATRLQRAVEEEIYRLVQEALNNVVKHANARHVTLRRVCAR